MSEQPKDRLARPAIVGAGMGLAIVLLFSALYQVPVFGGLFKRAEYVLYDMRLSQFPRSDAVTDEILVLKVDDATLRELEIQRVPWPFPRWVYGDLVAALSKLQPRAIVFDWVFADQRDGAAYGMDGDPFAAVSSTSANAQFAGLEFSRQTAHQMHDAKNVVHGIYAMNLKGEPQELLKTSGWNPHVEPYFVKRLPAIPEGLTPSFEATPGFTAVLRYPEASMIVGARALGLVNQQHLDDLDGITRRFEPICTVDKHVTSDLALAALVVASEHEERSKKEWPLWPETRPPPADQWPPHPAVTRKGTSLEVGRWTIPLDATGHALIRWRGQWESNPNLMGRTANMLEVWNAQDALALAEKLEDVDPSVIDVAKFKDKIILIGFTGQGESADFVNTPFGPQPGVYRHAAILDTILTGDFPQGLPTAYDWAVAIMLAGASGAWVLSRAGAKTRISRSVPLQVLRLSVIGFTPVALFCVLAVALFSLPDFGLQYPSVVMQMMPSILAGSTTVPVVIFLGIAWAQAGERRARKMAVRALGPALVKEVENSGGEMRMGGERRPLTLYFSDIAGFTTISEKLSPEELINMLNEYLTRVSEILHDGHGATIDKYIGDAVMAFWGAPIAQPDGPVKACMAALDVMKAIDTYSAELVAQGLSPLKTRIGINTGMAVAGGVGHVRDDENGKFSYTAMGDTVNLASRLEGANKAYGTTCMLGPETYESAKHAILARELDLVRVKGKTIPVRVYELMGKASDPLPEKRIVKERYEKALVLYRNRQFEEARKEFQALISEFGDTPSKTLSAACDEMLRTPPPPSWDGSNELHEK